MKKPRAASLIYALVIVTVLMVVAGTMAASFLRTSQRTYDMFRGTQAYYASRAAMEVSFSLVSSEGIGYETTSEEYFGGDYAVELDTDGDGSDDVFGEFEIFARARQVGWRDEVDDCGGFSGPAHCYLVPIPGTGDAGDSCNFEEPADGDGDDGDAWDVEADDKCNWNKIAYGETITIPLYYEDDTGVCPDDEICNPAEIGLTSFYLRIRTPEGSDLSGNSDESIVNWEISGDCDTDEDFVSDKSCYLMAASGGTVMGGDVFDSYIDYTAINNAKSNGDYIVLNGFNDYYLGKDETKINRMIEEFLTSFAGDGDIEKEVLNPKLKLSVISPLLKIDMTTSVPYLEYQLITDPAYSDNKIVYTATGKSNGRLGSYIRGIQATQALGSDSVISFALQN
ncbi:hypothetical protein HN748_04410 [Candidatus Peregrinibacteria bacterium]|jgi:hypothetical protein|nr:hypothetical protein [Candidatus Peregrinibacteria bacterium]MBT7703453.1 hypothetical protein [Candidatus Peregrinibacteria bacterium]